MITIALLLSLSQVPQSAASAAPKAADEYIIGPQDVLNVTVFGEPDASRAAVTVDNDGTIDCPYIGRVQAGGQSPRVVVYGDSFVQAEFSRLEDTFAERLKARLVGRFGREIEVVNAG